MPRAGIKSTHGSGFCNLNLFLAHSRQYSKAAGTELIFINTPTSAEMVTFLGMGQVDIGLMPYTSFMALYDKGAPVKIVAGGGVEGCAIVARPGLDTPEKLKGKTLGTFQMDTLEVMPYDYLKKHKISFKDVKVRYMGNTPEAVEAFKAGAIDWICTIEPYASALVTDVKGAVMLTNGIDLYGKGYTDCVLAARSSLIKDNPAGLKAIIKGMMQAQLDAETQTEAVLKELVGKYYKTSMENAKIAQGKQPAVVDARSQTDFILRAHRQRHGDGLHQEEARPRRHRLDHARRGDQGESRPLRQAQVQVRLMAVVTRDGESSGAAAGASRPAAASRLLRLDGRARLAGQDLVDLPVDQPVRRPVGTVLGDGLGGREAAAAAAHLPRQHRRAGQVLQHRHALAGRHSR